MLSIEHRPTFMNPSSVQKNRLRAIAVLAIIGAALIFCFGYLQRKTMPAGQIAEVTLTNQPLFSGTLTEAGINADDIGFHDFSSDGKYFLFTTFSPVKNPANETRLLTLATGALAELPGLPERGFDDSRILQLFDVNRNLILYFTADGSSKTYALGENVFGGFLSPDGNTYLVNTAEGIKRIDLATDTITELSTSQYDGAYAWLSDNKRIIGYKESGENLFEAGKGRTLGVWDVTTGNFSPYTNTVFQEKNIRYIEWLIPNKVIRVNTGWDDGSHDFLIDVKTGKVADMGDTSGALFGGMAIDRALELFAVLNLEYNPPKHTARVTVYNGALAQIHNQVLPAGYQRESMHIVDRDTLLYIRKTIDMSKGYQVTKNELVKLAIPTATEAVIRELPDAYTQVSLAPDHTTWVVSAGDRFISGKIK